MNRIKKISTGFLLRMTAVLAAILFCAAVPGQTALTGYAANTLGSQGSQGNSSEGNEDAGGAEDAGGELDDEVNNIINENAAEGINGSTASKIKIIAASARVRSEASTSSSVVGSLASGDVMDVTGETTGSDGKVWYQITGEKDGKAINGYVREDTLEVTETAQPEAPAEVPEETPAEEPSDTAPSTNDYDVSYADDGMGNNDWYLNDNVKGTRYKISDLLGAAQTNETNIDTMEKQTGSLRLIIIILAVIIGLLVIVVTVMIFKLKAAYEDGYDEYGDEDDEDEDDEDMDDDDEDDEEEEDEDDRYSREEEYDEPPRRSSRSTGKGRKSQNYKPRNFLDIDDDDDLDFEFLDLK